MQKRRKEVLTAFVVFQYLIGMIFICQARRLTT
jgi:hypothetical protein